MLDNFHYATLNMVAMNFLWIIWFCRGNVALKAAIFGYQVWFRLCKYHLTVPWKGWHIKIKIQWKMSSPNDGSQKIFNFCITTHFAVIMADFVYLTKFNWGTLYFMGGWVWSRQKKIFWVEHTRDICLLRKFLAGVRSKQGLWQTYSNTSNISIYFNTESYTEI